MLEGIGECYFCLWMEEILGLGGYNVVCGYGGLIVWVICGGWLWVGDFVMVWEEEW